jgi:predicted ATPase
MLERFTAKRYRQLDVENLELGRLNLFVGPNNSGKSNFIRAIRFLKHLFFPRHDDNAFLSALNTRGRGDLLDRDAPVPADIDLAWTLSPTPGAGALTYELTFKVDSRAVFPDGCYITKEALRRTPSSGKPSSIFERSPDSPQVASFLVGKERMPWNVSPQETVLRSVAPTADLAVAACREIKSYCAELHSYECGQINPRAVADGARRNVLAKSLDAAGVELANILRHLDQNEGLDEYTRLLGQMIPDLRTVKPVDIGDEQVGVRLRIGDGRPLKLSEMSDGTIKAMILALLVSTPVHMSLLALDEPELNLHPAWQHILGKWLVECRSADQLIISTHSPELLDVFTHAFREKEAELFVFGGPRHGVRRVTPEELDTFFQEGWELGDLYRVGEPKLGGWPW